MRMLGSARFVSSLGMGALIGALCGCTPAEAPSDVSDTGTPVASAQPVGDLSVAPANAVTAPATGSQNDVRPPTTGSINAQTPVAPAGRKVKKQAPDFDSNLVSNGSFEMLRDDGTLSGWAVAPNDIVTVGSGPAVHGKNAITITSTDETYGILACKIRINPADLGKQLHISAWGISDSHWNMSMNLEAVQGGEKTTLARIGWGEAPGIWTQVSLSAELPSDIDPASVQVRFVIKNEAGHQFQLDDLRATVAVLANGSFEGKAENGRPGGWAVSPVEAIRSADLVNAYDGDEVLEVESSDDHWTIVARTLDIRAADLGRKLTVAARARTPVDRGMFLSVQCSVNGEVTELGDKPWPASPEKWTQVQTTVTLPQAADPASFKARIKIRNKGGLRYYIDDVQAQLQ